MSHRRRSLARLGLGLLVLGAGGLRAEQPGAPTAPPLRLLSGDLPPFAIAGQAGRRGAMVELSELVLQRAGMAAQTEFYPWARSILMARNEPRVLIAPLMRTPERESQFQWLLRLYGLYIAFINRSADAPVTSLEQAHGLRVAVLRGTPDQSWLMAHGFDAGRLVLGSSTEDVLKLLERKMVDAVFGSDLMYAEKAHAQGRLASQLQYGLRQRSGDIWLAGSSGFEADERQRLQHAMSLLHKEGSVERVLRAYGLPAQPE